MVDDKTPLIFKTKQLVTIILNWIEEIQKDENKALKLLYKTYREGIILWLIKNYGLDEEMSTDIFQQAVISFYDKVIQNKVSDDAGKVKTYLYGICKNKALTYIKNNNREHKFIDNYTDFYVDSLKDQEEEIDNQEKQIQLINELLKKIGKPCKSILELFYYKMLNFDEITGILGYKNTNTTKNQKYKCIKRLQSMVLDINK